MQKLILLHFKLNSSYFPIFSEIRLKDSLKEVDFIEDQFLTLYYKINLCIFRNTIC